MTLNVQYKSLTESLLDTILIPFYMSDVASVIKPLTQDLNKIINQLEENNEFTGKYGEIQGLRLYSNSNPKKAILIGLGNRNELDLEKIRKAYAKAIKEANRLKSKSISVYPINVYDNISLSESVKTMTEGIILGEYKFDKYINDKKESTVKEVNFIYDNEDQMMDIRKGVDEGIVLAKATVLARDLVNEPANVLVPAKLAEIAIDTGKEHGFEVEVFEEQKIKDLGMEAFMSVARASANKPRFIVMRYFGDKQNADEILGLVGKGLTYDSGGLCLKTKDGMVNMKSDMGGAAAVIGAMSAIAKQKLLVNVVAVIAACENMIDGTAYRTGDIIDSMAGKTIFIASTDAEGRLTLADAIHYIIENEKATRIVDIATLTGGALHTLGSVATTVISNNDEFYNSLEEASKVSGEKVWRMPHFEEYKEQLKSKVADLTNSAGQPQAITAGLFVGEFVQEKPWIHMDIAGTAWSGKTTEYIYEGGTGVGARTLYYLVKIFEK